MHVTGNPFVNAVKLGIALSVVGVAASFFARNISDSAQVALVLATIVIAFTASMVITVRSRRTGGARRHRVSHIPVSGSNVRAA